MNQGLTTPRKTSSKIHDKSKKQEAEYQPEVAKTGQENVQNPLVICNACFSSPVGHTTGYVLKQDVC